MKVTIYENLAVRIWDNLNECGLNAPSKRFRNSCIRSRNGLEKAMEKAGIGVQKSSNGRAELPQKKGGR